MKSSRKKKPSHFERMLEEIYDIDNMLHDEGYGAAERRYREIVASLLLFIENSLSSIRLFLSALTGCLFGLLLSYALKLLLAL